MNQKRRLTPVSHRQVELGQGFWHDRLLTNRQVTLPSAYEQIKRSGGLDAYSWDWAPSSDHPPMLPRWGDVPKWIEGAAYTLASSGEADAFDQSLAAKARDAIDRLLFGQKIDGYLYSSQISLDERWTNLLDRHELYEMGHAMEAAVAWNAATGDERFLAAMCKTADLIDETLGTGRDRRRGYGGHPEVELGLMGLFHATGERRYLNLAAYLVDERGREPNYFHEEALSRGGAPEEHRFYRWLGKAPYSYYQAHVPVRRQKEAVGHAVRALYLGSGMADVAAATGDATLLAACRRLWRSVTSKRMYITGGVGSEKTGETFTFDYDLPNETGYAETCASIALVFFAHRMLQIDADAEYADVIERAMYNGVLGGVSLAGDRFYYANPLAVMPQAMTGCADHVSPTRVEWFFCACCPPNIARFLPQVPGYIYSASASPRELYVHQYAQSRTDLEVGDDAVAIEQYTEYPWDGRVMLEVQTPSPSRWTMALRIPAWCRRARLKINGEPIGLEDRVRKGYARISRRWEPDDLVELVMEMPVQRIEAHPLVRGTGGRVALQRGPLVYCIEETDNGKNVSDLVLPAAVELQTCRLRGRLQGMVAIEGRGMRHNLDRWSDTLYAPRSSAPQRAADVTAIPFFARCNRKPGEMLVWIREA